jgi:hypothetical protein
MLSNCILELLKLGEGAREAVDATLSTSVKVEEG